MRCEAKEVMMFFRRPKAGRKREGHEAAVRYLTNRRMAKRRIVSGRVRVFEKRRRSRWFSGHEEGE